VVLRCKIKFMKRYHTLPFLYIVLLVMSSHSLIAEVEPYNYDFTIDKLNLFWPGKTLDEANKKYGKPELLKKTESVIYWKYNLIHVRYKFPIFVQVNRKTKKIMDFYARLPNYFLHNIFHQGLINRFGPQKHYYPYERSAVYKWENTKEGLDILYSGTCTITCFPIFVAVFPPKKPKGMDEYKPIMDVISGITREE